MSPDDAVAALLRTCRPGLEIRSLEYLGEGDFCRAWVMNGHRVVRIPRHDEAARALAREACLLRKLAPDLPVPVPLPTYVPCPSVGGLSFSSFSIHERIPGRELTWELWSDLPASRRARLARGVGGFLARLHALDAGVGRPCDVPEMDPRAGVASLLRKVAGGADSPLPESLRSRLATCFRRYLAEEAPGRVRPALLHGDLGPGHVLVDMEAGRITGVIDWGDATVGDPARDFIFVYEDWGRAFLDSALEGYGLDERERLLPRIHLHYLADQLGWTLRAAEAGRRVDVVHGIAALEEGVRDFEAGAVG